MFNAYSIVENYLDDYRLKVVLSTSSSSSLYLAEKASLPGCIFLIKREKYVELNIQERQRAFLKRADELKAFRHPGVLPIIDICLDQSTTYIVTPYIENGSLYDRLKQQPLHRLSLEETYAVLISIGEALYAAHRENIIHGNLKTQNILFNAQNEALLTDFLLLLPMPPINITQACITDIPGDGRMQRHLAVSRNRGVASQLPSKESDQYALGAIAYELFTGKQPFTVHSTNNANKIYTVRTLIPPRQLNPDLDPSFEQVLLKALAKDPAQRYKDIHAFLEAIGRSYARMQYNTSESHTNDKNTAAPLWDEAIVQLAPPQPVEDIVQVPFDQAKGESTREKVLTRVLSTSQSLLIKVKPLSQGLPARLTSVRASLFVMMSFSSLRARAGLLFIRRTLQFWVLPNARRLLTTIVAFGRKLLVAFLSSGQKLRSGTAAIGLRRLYTGLLLVMGLFVLILFGITYSIYDTSMQVQPRSVINIQVPIKPTTSLTGTKSTAPTPSPTSVTKLVPQPAVIPPFIPTTPPPISPASSPSTLVPISLSCSVTYNIGRGIFNQFSATITIINTGTTTIDGWSLTWNYANGQRIYAASGAQYQQDGAQVTLQNLAANQVIQAGQQVNSITIYGFINGFRHAQNSNPTNFILNGIQCG